MNAKGYKPHTVPLTDKLFSAVRRSRQRYSHYLKEQKEKSSEEERNIQVELLEGNIKSAESRKLTLVNVCESLNKEFIELIVEAEKKSDFTLLSKGTALKRKADEKNEEILGIDADITILKEKRRKLKGAC